MKMPIKIGLLASMIWMGITLIFFYSGHSKEGFDAGILINVFLLLSGIAVGLYLKRREEKFVQTAFLEDLKSAMQAGIVYTIAVAAFVYYYHENVDPSIKNGLIDARIEALHEAVPDAEAYKELQAKDNTWQDKSYDDYIENQEDIIHSVISSKSVFLMHLAGLFFFSLIYSFFSVIVLRKVVLRN
jgi:hypothetical protein